MRKELTLNDFCSLYFYKRSIIRNRLTVNNKEKQPTILLIDKASKREISQQSDYDYNQKMLHLSRQSLTQSFTSLGYSALDYLYADEITKSLDQLNQQQFDRETLQQLLNQCTTNSKGQIKLQDLIMTFIKAENILVQRDVEIKKLLGQLQAQLNQKLRNQVQNIGGIQQLEDELGQAKEEQVQNAINLQIIRKPFINQKATSPRTPKSRNQQPLASYSGQYQPSQFVSVSLPGEGLLNIANTHTFTWIFQLSCLLLLITLPCMFYIPCYMNLILLLLIVLNMTSGYFCRYIIRVWMVLVLISILTDIVWYIIGARQLWQGNKTYPNYINSYIRLTLILNCVVDVGKLVLFILLASEYNVDQSQKKVVSVFGLVEISLSHDQVQKNLFTALNKGNHHHGRMDDQEF